MKIVESFSYSTWRYFFVQIALYN